MLNILLTNDDGIFSEGLKALYEELINLSYNGKKFNVTVVAPSQEQSGASHSITLNRPLRMAKVSENKFAIDGTPVDCILFGISEILKKIPDMIISGINRGANIGDDTIYSGTVAAARDGSMYSVPSFAFSLELAENMDFSLAAKKSIEIIKKFLDRPLLLPSGFFLNVNIPSSEIKGIKVARLSRKFSNPFDDKKPLIYGNNDPRGKRYYWIGQDNSFWDETEDTDYYSLTHGYITITPMHRDQTSYNLIEAMKKEFEISE